MNATIRDANAIRAINPLALSVYLRHGGWNENEQDARRAIWTLRDFEAVVPLDSTFRDYALRISEVLATLAAAEERSQLEIFEDLTNAGADVVRLRLIDADVEGGSIPLDDAASMGAKSRELMLSAACAEKAPKQFYGPKKPNEANEYLRGVRMGQTEHGSFVMKLLSPVPPRLEQHRPATGQTVMTGADFPEPPTEEHFSRRVMLRLARALRATQTAALQAAGNGSFESFERVVSEGVSANLCDALTGLGGKQASNRRLEVNISWALSRPLETPVDSRVVFASDSFPIIAEAARIFRQNSPRDEFEVYGPVIHLDKTPNSNEGTVYVHAFVDDQPRKIFIQLPTEEYHKAQEAHDKKPIRCTGTLVKEGKLYKLRNPSPIEIVEADE